MGNLSSKRHIIQRQVRQNIVNNNAYNFRNESSLNPQFTSIDSSLWPKPKRPLELRIFETSGQNQVTEVSDILGKTTTLVDLSDTSTLTISSDEISSRSSSDTLHPTQSSMRNQSSVEEKHPNRSGSGDIGGKSIANSDYLYLESLSIPNGCNRFQPKQISSALEDKLLADVPPHKPPMRKEKKPPEQRKPFPSPKTSRQPFSNFKNARSASRLSVTPGLRTREDNNTVSDPKLRDCQPQKTLPASSRSSLSQSTTPLCKPVLKLPQSTPRHVKQIENHNSHQMPHYSADNSTRSVAYPFNDNESHLFTFMNNASHVKNVSLSNTSVNFSSSPHPRQPCFKRFKNSSNIKNILLSPKDSSQSYVRSCVKAPKSSKHSLRSPIMPKSTKVDHSQRPIKTHGLRKISDCEYQRYNAIINDFHYYMKTRRNSETCGQLSSNSRSPSVESKNSSIDNPKSNKAYDETDDEIYSFPVSTTHVRPPSQTERSQSVGSFGDSRQNLSSCSNYIKSVTSSGRTLKHSTAHQRSRSLLRSSTHNYIVEIDGNIKELRHKSKDHKAIFCYKFLVNDGGFMQKILNDSKDHRIETICRQTSCRIHVKRRWLRHCSQPPSYDIIVFAREIKNIEKCCNLFNVMFPSFNAEAGLGY